MHSTQDVNMSADEKLAEATRKFPVIYDKTKSRHREKTMVENVWKCVIWECLIADVKTAKRLYDNLIKRFNKRRKKLRGGEIGNLEEEGGKRQEGIRGTFVFILAWAIRCAEEKKTNRPQLKEMARENVEETSDDSSSEASDNEGDTNLEPDNDDFSGSDSDVNQGVVQTPEVTTEETAGPSNGEEGVLFSATVESAIETKRRKSNTTNTKKQQQSKVSETKGNLKWHQKDSFEEAQMNFFRTAEKATKSTEKEDPPRRESENNDTTFGKFVASEIQQLPDRYQK